MLSTVDKKTEQYVDLNQIADQGPNILSSTWNTSSTCQWQVWTQIRPDSISGLIWIQIVWHWWYFWKKISKVNFEKNQHTTKNHEKFLNMQTLCGLFKALNKSWTLEIAITLKVPISTSRLLCHLPKCFKASSAFKDFSALHFRGDRSWNNFYGHSSPFRWFKNCCCQSQVKYVHEVLVNCLGKKCG